MSLDDIDLNDVRNAGDYLCGVRGTDLYGPLCHRDEASSARWHLRQALRLDNRRAALYYLARLITSGFSPEERP